MRAEYKYDRVLILNDLIPDEDDHEQIAYSLFQRDLQ